MGWKKGVELDTQEFCAFSISDADELYELDRICRLSPWSVEGFRAEFSETYSYCWGRRDERGIVAFVMLHLFLDEAHILKIGVAPEARRQGIATRLMQFAIARGVERGMRSAYLEVRRSQVSAQSLYERVGFMRSGLRPNYYTKEDGYEQETEDALLYTLTI